MAVTAMSYAGSFAVSVQLGGSGADVAILRGGVERGFDELLQAADANAERAPSTHAPNRTHAS